MGLETVTYIDDLVIANPAATDDKSQGDDHIRNIKKAIKASFPSVDGAVTSTDSELNILDGVTSTAAELNILDGVTSTAAELNILDGVTSTAAELNLVDGLTTTVAELNNLDAGNATQGDILYFGSSGTPAKLGFGTAGKSLITGGTGANPSWSSVATGTLTAGNALTTGGTNGAFQPNTTTTQAHGLGAIPLLLDVVLECLSDEAGYVDGEFIDGSSIIIAFKPAVGSILGALTVKKDATNLILNTATSLVVVTDGGGTPISLTDAKWKVIITPYRLN